MAKNMALLENGLVANILWCSDQEPETGDMVAYGELPVKIGDAYSAGKFFRDGQEILSEKDRLRAQNEELLETMAQMVEDIYASDLAEIEEG